MRELRQFFEKKAMIVNGELLSKGLADVDTSVSPGVVGEVLSGGWEPAVPVSGGEGGVGSGADESIQDLLEGPRGVGTAEEADGTSDVRGGHGGSGHGDVVVGASSAGDNVLSWGRDFGLEGSSRGGSPGGEGGHGVGGGGGSDGNVSGVAVSGRVGGTAVGSRVTDGEDWDDSSVPHGGDGLVVPDSVLATSPGVGGHMGHGPGLDGELGTSDEGGFSSGSLMVQPTAGNPLGSGGNSDSVGVSQDGSSTVTSVTVLIGGLGGAVVGVSPSSGIPGEGFVSWGNSSVDDDGNASGSLGDGPGSWGTDHGDSPLWVLDDGGVAVDDDRDRKSVV